MLSARAFEWSDIAAGRVHSRVEGWMENVAKKVWEKFAAFVVKCREARKHQGSRWLRTRLQPVYGCSL